MVLEIIVFILIVNFVGYILVMCFRVIMDVMKLVDLGVRDFLIY